MNVSVIGAGIFGQLVALAARSLNWQVSVFDRLPALQHGLCSQAAGGLLTPVAELEHAPDTIFLWGLQGLERWPLIARYIDLSFAVQAQGSIWVAHPGDRVDFEHLIHRLQTRMMQLNFNPDDYLHTLSHAELAQREPELAQQFSSGLWIPQETALPVRACLTNLYTTLQSKGVKFHFNCHIETIAPYQIGYGSQKQQYDWVFDCRGLAAMDNWPELRGVRGELIELYAPEVRLHYPIRCIHPRYALYIVPQGESIYRVGASQIESADQSAISVQSLLELLSAAYSVNRGFLHARMLQTMVQCRPCLPSAIPEIRIQQGLIALNGLYRHGYLLAPILVEQLFATQFDTPLIWQNLNRGAA